MRNVLSNLLGVAGVFAVAYGVSLLSLAAGVVVAGVAVVLIAWRLQS